MKFIASFIVFSCLCGTSINGAPQGDPSEIKLVRYSNDNNGIDNYHYLYELDNGQIHAEVGELKEVGPDNTPAIVVRGSYTFVGPDGQVYWVNYTADENGYHPVVGTGPVGGIQGGGDVVGIEPGQLKSLLG